MGKLDHKVAMVTGASRGIGLGIARALAKEGANVTLAARDESSLEKAEAEIKELGVEVLSVPTDVKDEAQVESLFAKHQEKFGRLDLLYSNAGAFNGGSFGDLSTEDWDHVMGVNLRGPFLCGRAAFRIMKPQGGGRIINLGSISAQRPREGSAPYSTSKFGIWGLTQAMALDGRADNIVVSCLHPGNVLTERRAESAADSDQEPMMTVDELAEVALLMGTLPSNVNFLEAIVLPTQQLYLGRG